MASEVLLAIQVLHAISANAPWIIAAIKEGREADINWNALRPADRATLEAEVDAQEESYDV